MYACHAAFPVEISLNAYSLRLCILPLIRKYKVCCHFVNLLLCTTEMSSLSWLSVSEDRRVGEALKSCRHARFFLRNKEVRAELSSTAQEVSRAL